MLNLYFTVNSLQATIYSERFTVKSLQFKGSRIRCTGNKLKFKVNSFQFTSSNWAAACSHSASSWRVFLTIFDLNNHFFSLLSYHCMFRLSLKDLICAHFLTLNPAVSEAHYCEAGAPPVCYAAPPSCTAPLPLPARASLSSLEVIVSYNSLGCLFPCHLLQEVCLHWGIRHGRLLARLLY